MAFGLRRDRLSGGIQSNYAAAGDPRYGGSASYTATTGAVDGTGYQEREMRRRARRRAIDRQMRMGSQQSISTPLGGGML
jgi:hypothetical protein